MDERGHVEGGGLILENADSAVILIALGTNYKMESRVFTEPEDKQKLAPYPHPHGAVAETMRLASQKTFDELLAGLGLLDKAGANMRQLSGGMKRRVLVAQALVHKPPVIVLDEPTAGVDVELRQGLWQFVRRLNGEGHTIILTTHYLEEAEALCGRIALMKQGRVIALDTTANLIAAHPGGTVVALGEGLETPMLVQQREGPGLFCTGAESIGTLLDSPELFKKYIENETEQELFGVPIEAVLDAIMMLQDKIKGERRPLLPIIRD